MSHGRFSRHVFPLILALSLAVGMARAGAPPVGPAADPSVAKANLSSLPVQAQAAISPPLAGTNAPIMRSGKGKAGGLPIPSTGSGRTSQRVGSRYDRQRLC
jgi:hypothetical protein